MAKAKAKDNGQFDLPVSYGGVSFGKKTARVGVSIDRSLLTLKQADDHLCDRRLTVKLHANPSGDQPGQKRLEGMEEDIDLAGVADVKGFGVHTSTIGFGLTFNATELKKVAAATGVQFNDFAAKEGRMIITEVTAIPEEEDAEEGEADVED